MVNLKRIKFVRREQGYTQPSSSLAGDQDRLYGKNVKNGPIFGSMETLSYIHLTLRNSFDSHEYGIAYGIELEGTCACAKKTPRQQYLMTWCQRVVPNDFPRDFG